MAAPLLTRSPTCLSCLHRSLGGTSSGWSSIAMTQVRGKKSGRPQDKGIVVRLLEDIPNFGRKDVILRVDRGRMRNLWYPKKMAEYMTTARFSQLGLTQDAVVERDPLFGTYAPAEAEDDANTDAVRPIEIRSVTPERASMLLNTLLPATLTFSRRPNLASEAPKPASSPAAGLSPLIARSAAAASSPLAIFGSVSVDDVAASIRDMLRRDPEASLVRVEGRDVRFVGLEDDVDRVRMLGRWEVEITVRSDAAGKGVAIEPVRKVVEVVAASE